MSKKISIFERTDDVFPDPHKTNPVEMPAFKKPEEPRKPLKASADASKFLKKIGPQTKLDTPFDRANKEVDKMAAGVHKDTTSVAGRMKAAGVPAPKADYKAPAKPDAVDKLSPDAKGAYQGARSGSPVSTSTNLDRPAIWRAQEKAAAGLGKHDYNVGKHSAPVAPKAKTDPIASQSPQGAGSDPIASQKTSAAPVETPAPSVGSTSMADAPAPKAPAAPAPAIGMTKPGESNPLNKSKKERQTTPRGNKVAGEPEEPSSTPPAAPAGPPPLAMGTPEYQAKNTVPEAPPPKAKADVAAEKAANTPPPVAPPRPKAEVDAEKAAAKEHGKAVSGLQKEVNRRPPKPSRAGRQITNTLASVANNLVGQAGKFIAGTTRVKNYTK